MVTREEVIWLYRCILNRAPESEAIINSYMHESNSFSLCRRTLLQSEEFRISEIKQAIKKEVRYRGCDLPRQPFICPKKNILALACIVKNEAASVARMLSSALPLVSFVSVLDTGSSDATMEIARGVLEAARVPHRIEQSEFVDFSHARNMALDLVPSEILWTLMLDADEYLVESDYPALVALLAQTDFDGWQLPRYNFCEEDRLGRLHDYPDFQRRLIKNDPAIRYVGRVHEYVQNITAWGFAPIDLLAQQGRSGGPHIHHSALINITFEKAHGKRLFYEALA